MPNVALYDIKGQNIGDIALSENVFGQPVNTAVMHEVVAKRCARPRRSTWPTTAASRRNPCGRS